MAEDLAQGHPAQPEEGAGDLAPGWRPDPHGRHPYRFWDGTAWTAYVSNGRETQWDSAPIADSVERAPGLPGVGTAIAGFVVGVALSFLVQRVVDDVSRPVELLISSLALWSGLLGAVLIVSRRRGTGSLVRDLSLRFRWSDLGFGLAASFAARLLAAYAVTPVPLPHRRIEQGDKTIVGNASLSTAGWILLALVICVGAPLVEEIFFRGLVQSRLVDRWGVVPGIAVASVLFGAAHLIAWDGPLSLAYAWAIASSGVVLGVAYWSSGRLGTSICTHALFNAQALLVIALLR